MISLKALFLTFIIIAALHDQSPGKNLDSLLHELKYVREDTGKAKILFSITWEFLKARDQLDPARKYADSAMLLCRKLGYVEGVAIVHYHKGVINRFESAYDSGLLNFQKYHDYYQVRGDSFRVANSLYQMAVIHSLKGDYEKSLRDYLRILKIYEAKQDAYSQATTLNSVGIVYKNLKKYSAAFDSYNRALAILDTLNAPLDKADCLSNLGSLHAEQDEYEKALDYFQKALDIDTESGNEWGVVYQLKNIGSTLVSLEKYDQALVYNKRAVASSQRLGQQKEIAMALNGLGGNYTFLGRYDEAIYQFHKSLHISESIGAKPEIRDTYDMMSHAYAMKEDYPNAYKYHRLYAAVKDSLLNEVNARQINELQARYDAEKRENEIEMLTAARELQEARLLQERNLRKAFMTGGILLALLAILIVVIYRQKLKAKELIERKNAEINRQKLLEMEKNQKLYALDAMISGQEVERKRIAQDLHDGLGALLSTVQNHFTSIRAEIEKLHKLDVYTKANELLDEACAEVRKIAHNMMPGTLVKLGLAPALKDLCENLSAASGIQIQFHAFGMEDRLDDATEITIYRLAQESLNNVIKHSHATEALVQLANDNGHLNLTIEDNGAGFKVAEATGKKGMGLRNLESRVKYLNGILTIHSEPGKGTSIDMVIPVYQREMVAHD